MGLQVSQHKSGIHYAVRSSSCPSTLECEKNVNVSGHTERTFCPLQKFHVCVCCPCSLALCRAGCTYVSLSVCCVCRVIHTESAAFLVDNFFVVCACVCVCVCYEFLANSFMQFSLLVYLKFKSSVLFLQIVIHVCQCWCWAWCRLVLAEKQSRQQTVCCHNQNRNNISLPVYSLSLPLWLLTLALVLSFCCFSTAAFMCWSFVIKVELIMPPCT